MRFALGVCDAFVAFTAIWGGIWLVAGLERDRFPLKLLEHTPFHSYVIPGLILGVLVGGSSALALAAVIASPADVGAVASMMAATVLVGWIGGELLLLRRPSLTEFGYFAMGVLVTVLGFVVLV